MSLGLSWDYKPESGVLVLTLVSRDEEGRGYVEDECYIPLRDLVNLIRTEKMEIVP